MVTFMSYMLERKFLACDWLTGMFSVLIQAHMKKKKIKMYIAIESVKQWSTQQLCICMTHLHMTLS